MVAEGGVANNVAAACLSIQDNMYTCNTQHKLAYNHQLMKPRKRKYSNVTIINDISGIHLFNR